MWLTASTVSTLSAQCVLSAHGGVGAVADLFGVEDDAVRQLDQGTVPGVADGAWSFAGGNPLTPATSTWVGEKSTPAGTLIALGRSTTNLHAGGVRRVGQLRREVHAETGGGGLGGGVGDDVVDAVAGAVPVRSGSFTTGFEFGGPSEKPVGPCCFSEEETVRAEELLERVGRGEALERQLIRGGCVRRRGMQGAGAPCRACLSRRQARTRRR